MEKIVPKERLSSTLDEPSSGSMASASGRGGIDDAAARPAPRKRRPRPVRVAPPSRNMRSARTSRPSAGRRRIDCRSCTRHRRACSRPARCARPAAPVAAISARWRRPRRAADRDPHAGLARNAPGSAVTCSILPRGGCGVPLSCIRLIFVQRAPDIKWRVWTA